MSLASTMPVSLSAKKAAANLPLEGLRGVACLLVALSHVFYVSPLDPTYVVPQWLQALEGGHAGVLIFFMLSGYLISWTNRGDCTPVNRRRYLFRRFVRIAPIYYLALALTVAVTLQHHDQGQGRTLAAAFLGLQNFNEYFGLNLNVPARNSPLWSLNYELLYYGLFLLLWRYQPRLGWVFIPALVAAIIAWFAPQVVPLFIGSYACGWLFWAAGWWLARLPERPAHAPVAPILTWLLLAYAAHRICGVMRILNALGWHSADAGMINLGNLGLFPPIVLLLAALGNRQLPFPRVFAALAWLLCLVPLAGMVWTGRLWADPRWIAGGIAVVLAAVSLPVRSITWLKSFAGLGGISYAFYVVHFPLLFALQPLPWPGGTLPAYLVRILVWATLAVALAWLLERKFQPWIKTRLSPAART